MTQTTDEGPPVFVLIGLPILVFSVLIASSFGLPLGTALKILLSILFFLIMLFLFILGPGRWGVGH